MKTLRLQGDASIELDNDVWRLWLEADPEEGLAMRVRIDPEAPIAWAELDKLPKLVELEYQGRDPGVVGYATTREGLKTLRWLGHRAERIDLSRSALTELSVDVAGPLSVALPRSLTTLRLLDTKSFQKLRIESADEGARLAIWIWAPRGPLRAFAGVPRLQTLSVGAVSSLDLTALAAWPALERLEIFGDDGGVEIKNVAKLAGKSLAEISIRNAFHTDFSRFPTPEKLPGLRRLELDGLRTDAAALIKERYRGFRGLSVRGVRSDAWLRQNADNPFREWAEEYGVKMGTRATRAYRAAHAAIDKAKPNAKQAEAILRAFVDAFNPVADAIDTIQREELDEAYHSIAARLEEQVPPKRATEWFDSWRDF